MSDPITVALDRDGRIANWSRNAWVVLGCGHHETPGSSLEGFAPLQKIVTVVDPLQGYWQVELDCKAGKFDCEGVVLFDEKGMPAEHIVTLRLQAIADVCEDPLKPIGLLHADEPGSVNPDLRIALWG